MDAKAERTATARDVPRLPGIGALSVALPFLTAACSVLLYYHHNINELMLGDALPALGAALGFAALVFLFLLAVLRRLAQAALAATVIGGAALYFRGIFETLQAVLPVHLSLLAGLAVVVAGMLALVLAIVLARRHLQAAVLGLGVFLLVQAGWLAVDVANYELRRWSTPEVPATVYDGLAGLAAKDEPPRHIFYIVLDRYAAASTLKSVFDHDNSGFIGFLQTAGFTVPPASAANYFKTGHSLASTLNMTYLDYLAEDRAVEPGDNTPVFNLLRDFRVARVLKRLGYRYALLGSWWGETQSSPYADYNLRNPAFSEFELNYLGRTILPALARLSPRNEGPLDSAGTCQAIKDKFRTLREMDYLDGPTFVFAHFLVPHPPYVIDADGRCLTAAEAEARGDAASYVAQVRYVSAEIRRFVETVRQRLDPQPIIILQSDEGPYPSRYTSHHDGFDWHQATPTELRQKARILNAYYLPGIARPEIADDITPVNSFRMVLNLYFGARMKLLDDRVIAFSSFDDIYDFFDVTDVVQGGEAR